MNDNQRWKARRERAQRAAIDRLMKSALSEVCQKHLPDWPEDKVAAAWSLMSAGGLVDEMIAIAEGMSEEQWAAVRKAAGQVDGDA